jgi:hypothetical protein
VRAVKSVRVRYAVALSSAALVTALGVWRGYAVAPAGRYDTSTADVVLDTKTRLLWQKELQAGLAFTAAKNYCLGRPGGGWRLPSVHELMTIVDDTTTKNVKIDETVFPDVTMASARAWTATPVSGDSTRVWTVNFYVVANITETGVAASTPRTRCVRLADP